VRGKLVVVILAVLVVASALLVIRQQRLEAVAGMARAIDRATALERDTWAVRAAIAREIERVAAETAAQAAGGGAADGG
jgi:hypothetical protein